MLKDNEGLLFKENLEKAFAFWVLPTNVWKIRDLKISTKMHWWKSSVLNQITMI